MEPENPLPCSQEPVIGLYPEVNKYTPHPHKLFLKDSFYYYPSVYVQFFPSDLVAKIVYAY